MPNRQPFHERHEQVLLGEARPAMELSDRITGFAGDIRLAQPAAGDTGGKIVAALEFHRVITDTTQVFSARYLVVTLVGDSTRRTAFDTLSAYLPGQRQAVGKGSRGRPWAGGQCQVGYHAAATVGDAFLRDETIGKAEGAETGGIGDMPLGPVGEHTFFITAYRKEGCRHRSDRPETFSGEKVHDELPQGVIEQLPEPAGVRPLPRGEPGFRTVGFSCRSGNRQYPRYHRKPRRQRS